MKAAPVIFLGLTAVALLAIAAASKKPTADKSPAPPSGAPDGGTKSGIAIQCPEGTRPYYFGSWPRGYWGCTGAKALGTGGGQSFSDPNAKVFNRQS